MRSLQTTTLNPATPRAAWLVVRIELFIFAGVAAACWLLGWHTLGTYANGLVIAGVALLAFGLYSLVDDQESFMLEIGLLGGIPLVAGLLLQIIG